MPFGKSGLVKFVAIALCGAILFISDGMLNPCGLFERTESCEVAS